MAKQSIPLNEVSIEELFSGSESCTYEIPIYQRNYAWEKDEITTLVQDIYDSYKKDNGRPYFIGTLVSYNKGDRVFEIIDGQQRLTTLRLLLAALGIWPDNKLSYRARKKSDDTLKHIYDLSALEEKDYGIENGFKYVQSAIGDLIPEEEFYGFIEYFKTMVHIIHYQVPKDIDLNHYFEIMNSRGEQLEKHEIVKAKLMEKLDSDDERKVFNRIWECCSEMSVYAQQNIEDIKPEDVYGDTLECFFPETFEEILVKYQENRRADDALKKITILHIIDSGENGGWAQIKEDIERKDSFQPIIDFPNFLLIVLKLLKMEDEEFSPEDFKLDDKELINEFDNCRMDAEKVRKFGYYLLKARFFLDNFIVHHSKEEDTIDSNPWKLQVWHKDKDTKKGMLKNLSDDKALQERLAQLLSMFEVSFTARQRKNYLFYCLLYLIKKDSVNLEEYATFLENLADRYFHKVYLDAGKLNAKNTPLPGSFDASVLKGRTLRQNAPKRKDKYAFYNVYGDGIRASKGIPLFVFNYLDYKLWKMYVDELRGDQLKEGSRERNEFFAKLGCTDFGLKVFAQFYFSRTRRSLEHYYPQANATGEDGALNQSQINCLGNYAMIGSEANSAGSNWTPKTKLDHYLDASGKISQISVASLKFIIMMQMCKDNQQWEFEEIQEHQERMIDVLLTDTTDSED